MKHKKGAIEYNGHLLKYLVMKEVLPFQCHRQRFMIFQWLTRMGPALVWSALSPLRQNGTCCKAIGLHVMLLSRRREKAKHICH